MLPNFAALPPEVNSARLHAGAGPAPLLAAATAWDGLATEIDCAAGSFESTIAGLTTGSWLGPAALQMTAVAAPYLSWLRHAAAHAQAAAALARTAAAEFETALSTAVHPALVAMNRSEALWLAASNLFGQNAPAIAAAESRYADMWAQDVTAMTAYHTGIDAICAELVPWHQRLQTLLGAATPRGSATGTPGVLPPRRRRSPKSWGPAAFRRRRPGTSSAPSTSSFATWPPTPFRDRCSPRRVSTLSSA